MSSFSYSERLRLLNLNSLEMRRLRADLMLCFKMLKEFVDVDASEFLNVLLLTLSLMAIATSLFIYLFIYLLGYSSVRINVRQHFFAVRFMPVWNSLSSNIVEAESISYFKARLSKENLTKFVNI